MNNFSLSKSQYTRYLKCPKSLWLLKHHPEIKASLNDTQQAIVDQGTMVGELAQDLFPNGVTIEFNSKDYDAMLNRTKELIDSGVQTIYEAAFKEDNVFVMVDILHLGGQGWELYEVKSSTSVKPYHIDDASIQWHVLTTAGLTLSKAAIVVLNNKYRRHGELDLHQLFKVADVTDEVTQLQRSVRSTLDQIQNALDGSQPEIPIGPQCGENYDCEFMNLCWGHIPEASIFNIYRMQQRKKFELYNNGIIRLEDLTDEVELSPIQQLQVSCTFSGTTHIDRASVSEFLMTIEAPISYLDFETFADAVPRYSDQKVYQAMPFQYSLHIATDQDSLEEQHLTHKEFLAKEGNDPRRAFAERLLEDIPQHGSIIVYNQAFEKRIIKECAEKFDDLRAPLMFLIDRIVDLLTPFQSGKYYHPKFNGSFSIKSVLPALFPDNKQLNYKELEIQNGAVASMEYAQLDQVASADERNAIRNNLIQYCALDTLAMVKIHQLLRTETT